MEKAYLITAPFRLGPFSKNGAILHGPWKESSSIALCHYDGNPAPGELATSVRACHDSSNLYVLFVGRYDRLRTAPAETPRDPSTGKTHRLWDLSDVYEIFIGPDARHSGLYREFQAAPDSRIMDIAIDAGTEERKADFNWCSGFSALSVKNEKIWEALFRIPFSAFSIIPGNQDIWNCNFYRIAGEEPRKHYLSWSPVHKIAFHQPRYFGSIQFTGEGV